MSIFFSVGVRIQGLMHARKAFYQLRCTPAPLSSALLPPKFYGALVLVLLREGS